MAINGQCVKDWREAKRITATDLAGRLHISLSYLGDIEAGRRTLKRNPDLIGRIADELNIDVSYITRPNPVDDRFLPPTEPDATKAAR